MALQLRANVAGVEGGRDQTFVSVSAGKLLGDDNIALLERGSKRENSLSMERQPGTYKFTLEVDTLLSQAGSRRTISE